MSNLCIHLLVVFNTRRIIVVIFNNSSIKNMLHSDNFADKITVDLFSYQGYLACKKTYPLIPIRWDYDISIHRKYILEVCIEHVIC